MKRDRKGGHEAISSVTVTSAGHCCGPAGPGTNPNRTCCCQLHHGRSVAANGVNAPIWNASNSFQQQQPAHLYDIGNRQQKMIGTQASTSSSSFPIAQNQNPPPPPPPGTTTSGAAPRGVGQSTVATTASGTTTNTSSNRIQRHQNSQASGGTTDFLKIGAVWLDRYEITDIKGKGTFGQVFRAHDRKTHEEVAIKVIKNRRQFLAQAEIEIKLLREIAHFQENEQRAAEVGANYVGALTDIYMLLNPT